MTRTAWVAPLAVLVAIGVIVALAFYVRGFQGTGDDHALLPTNTGAPGGASGLSAHGHKHKHKHGKKHGKHSHKTKFVVPSDGPTVTLGAGGGGLTITGQHTLVVRVTSSAPIPAVGYLAPTSPDIPYGTAKNVGKNWSVHTTVSGKPKYAIIWIYSGKSGAPVTCSITIDGKLADRKATTGAYGRQICYA
jgi:hypothetical protein